jgi:hypothetical protein
MGSPAGGKRSTLNVLCRNHRTALTLALSRLRGRSRFGAAEARPTGQGSKSWHRRILRRLEQQTRERIPLSHRMGEGRGEGSASRSGRFLQSTLNVERSPKIRSYVPPSVCFNCSIAQGNNPKLVASNIPCAMTAGQMERCKTMIVPSPIPNNAAGPTAIQP